MKKKPFKKYEKETGRKPILAIMATESYLRKRRWLETGCNAFNNSRPVSNPMAFWTEQDVLRYLKNFEVPYASVYGDLREDKTGILSFTGCQRTGCCFCLYGIRLEKEPNRLQKLKISHPKIYEYCMRDVEQGGLGLKKVIDFMNEEGHLKRPIKY